MIDFISCLSSSFSFCNSFDSWLFSTVSSRSWLCKILIVFSSVVFLISFKILSYLFFVICWDFVPIFLCHFGMFSLVAFKSWMIRSRLDIFLAVDLLAACFSHFSGKDSIFSAVVDSNASVSFKSWLIRLRLDLIADLDFLDSILSVVDSNAFNTVFLKILFVSVSFESWLIRLRLDLIADLDFLVIGKDSILSVCLDSLIPGSILSSI